jgi:hypothetical protein
MNTMNTQQAYEEAIKLGKVQAAKVFKKQLNEQAMALLAICEELFPESATDSDYAALDNLISSPSPFTDVWGNAI